MSDCRDAITDYPNLSQSNSEAEVRYKKTKQCDPFPEIPPALLNSADIYRSRHARNEFLSRRNSHLSKTLESTVDL